MHTKSYNDSDGRKLVKKILEESGYDVYNPDYNTGKVGDLFCSEPNTGEWFIVEVEQMGDNSRKYVKDMKRFAKGAPAYGFWKGGFSIPPRKFEYTPMDHEVSDVMKEELGLDGIKENLKWSKYFRITPDQDGVFVADRDDVNGSIDGMVNTENSSFREERPAVPWNKVEYLDLG